MEKIIDTQAFIGKSPMPCDEIIQADITDFLEIRITEEEKARDLRFLAIPFSFDLNYSISELVNHNPTLLVGGSLMINPNGALGASLYTSPEDIGRILNNDFNQNILCLKLVTSLTKTKVNDNSLYPFINLAIKYDIPITFHCSATMQDYTNPYLFRELQDKNPELKIILAHYGGLNERYIKEMIKLVKDSPNIFLNTAGLSGEVARYVPEGNKFRIHREPASERWTNIFLETVEDIKCQVLFASDYPQLKNYTFHPLDKLSEETQSLVFYENAKRIFPILHI